MRSCSACGGRVEDDFRFCPACGAAQRTKIVESFRGRGDLGDGALQASVYLAPPRHVRLSIWRDERAEAVVSLDAREARRLGAFLLAVVPGRGRADAVARLRRVLARRARVLSR
jgi:hypothetical protein